MARLNAPLLAFNRGEVSKIALARVDLAKLQLAAQCQLNWEPKVVGSMGLRPGMEFIGSVFNNPTICRVLPFVFAKTDTALLELTHDVMRVWINDTLLTRPAVSTTVSDGHFNGGGTWGATGTTSGASATIGAGVATLTCAPRGGLAQIGQTIAVALADRGVEHALKVTITKGPVTLRLGASTGLDDLIAQTTLGTGFHSLSFIPTTATIVLQIESRDARKKTLTGVIIEPQGSLQLETPWALADLPNVRAEQSGDVVYVACYGRQQRKIERRGARPGARGWSVVKYESDNGPFQTAPSIAGITLTSSVYDGNGTLLASRPVFTADHLDALFQLFTPGQENQITLGAGSVFSEPIRVSGVNTDRRFAWIVSGTFTGTLTLQRSLDGPEVGFVNIASVTAPASTDQDDSNSAATPGIASLNNVVAWYRVGFATEADYSSGSALVKFGAHSTGFNAASAGGRFGICRVTAVSNNRLVDIEVLAPFSSLRATSSWLEGEWSGFQGFPTAVAFQEGRLTWTGRDKMWFGQSDDFTGYAVQDVNGNTLGDAGAIIETFGQGPVDTVSWILPLSRPLFGREMSISAARSSSFDEPLTAINFSVKDCSTQGAARLPAVKIDKRGVFVQQSGRRVYELVYEAQAQDYTASDLTRLNIDIGKQGFVDIAIARQPDTSVYLVRGDGQCAVLLYDPGDEVTAWWRIQTIGIILNVCVLPSASGIEDDVYFVVRRVVNGVGVTFLEKLARRDNCIGGTVNQLFDAHEVYQGPATTQISMPWLPNTLVGIWADGAYLGATVSDGAGLATLPGAASGTSIVAGLLGNVRTLQSDTPTDTFPGLGGLDDFPCEVFADQQPSGRMIHLGTLTSSFGVLTLPGGMLSSSIVVMHGYIAPFMSAKLAYAAQGGSALSQTKKVDHVGLTLFDAHPLGIQTGQRFDHLDALPAYEDGAPVPADTIWNEYDEPVVEAPGEWDTDARLCLLGQAPYPCKVGAAIVAVATDEK